MPSESNLEFQAMMEKAQRQKLLVRHQNEIIATYDKAFRDAFNELKTFENNTAVAAAKAAYTRQLYEELDALNKKYVGKVSQQTLDMHRDMIKQIAGIKRNMSPQQRKFMEAIDKNVKICNRRAVDTMVKGGIYKDGMGLDKRIWNSAKMSERKIDVAIRSCMARGISSAEAAGIIKEFGNGGHRIWDRKKIQEKLGSGYARSFSGGIDYEALRLMRTTHTHTAQLAVKESAKVNPYVGKVKWHSVHAAGRTCEQCTLRDGRVFKLDAMPFDHPNGMCWMESVFVNEKGMIMTPEKMAQDMRAWVEGKPNSGTMDKLYKDVPLSTQKAVKGGILKVKEVNTSKTEKIDVANTVQEGCIYTPVERSEKREYSAKTIRSQLLKEGLSGEEASKHAMGIMKLVDNLPVEVRDMYFASINKLNLRLSSDQENYFSPRFGYVKVDIDMLAKDKERGAYTVFMHEWAHMIDTKFGGVDVISYNEKFYKELRTDYETYLADYKKYYSYKNYSDSTVKMEVSLDLRREKGYISGVSDIYGGISKGEVQGRWAHSQEYWDRSNREMEVTSEAWAQLLQNMSMEERYKHSQTYLSRGDKWVMEKVKQINKRLIKKKGYEL